MVYSGAKIHLKVEVLLIPLRSPTTIIGTFISLSESESEFFPDRYLFLH